MKPLLNSLTQGEELRLRGDVLPLVQRRSWIFVGMGKTGRILLTHGNIGYTWQAKPDSIDWEEYEKRRNHDLPLRASSISAKGH